MKIYKIALPVMALAALASCSNSDNEFPDFEYQAIYFANQYPVRTVELGKDLEVNTDLDNKHQVTIKAVRAGAYGNSQNRTVEYIVDNTLCDNLYFSTGQKVEPLPSDYYSMLNDKIVIPAGSIDGGVTVQLTDKFFEDPKCLSNNYVIPVRLISASGDDRIMSGEANVENPNRHISSDWKSPCKDFVLYCMKYVNKYHAHYLRRGVDKITVGGQTTEIVRKQQYVERDEEVHTVTTGFNECEISLSTQIDGDHTYSYSLKLTFNDNGECTITSANPDMTASGTGKYVDNGEKNSIGGKDRDALYLEYTVNAADWSLSTTDTMVMRNRGVTAEYFEVVVQ